MHFSVALALSHLATIHASGLSLDKQLISLETRAYYVCKQVVEELEGENRLILKIITPNCEVIEHGISVARWSIPRPILIIFFDRNKSIECFLKLST